MILLRYALVRKILYISLGTLVLMPSVVYSYGHHGSSEKHSMDLTEFASGSHLVMENHFGNVIVRSAREAGLEDVAAVPETATVGGSKRGKNNKKLNKSNNQMQRAEAVGSRKPGVKKSPGSTDEELLQHGKHQRQKKQPQNEERQHRAGKRSGGKSKTSEKAPTCRYAKSSWTECDAKTNMRTRTMSLKKFESHCQPTRTIQKKCKKACRYEKRPWSECNAGQMTREETLIVSQDGVQHSCNPVRISNKKCNPGNMEKHTASNFPSTKVRKHKEKGTQHTSPRA